MTDFSKCKPYGFKKDGTPIYAEQLKENPELQKEMIITADDCKGIAFDCRSTPSGRVLCGLQ